MSKGPQGCLNVVCSAAIKKTLSLFFLINFPQLLEIWYVFWFVNIYVWFSCVYKIPQTPVVCPALPAREPQSGRSSEPAAPERKHRDSVFSGTPSPALPVGSWWRLCGCVSSCLCCFRCRRPCPEDLLNQCPATCQRPPWHFDPSQSGSWCPFQVGQCPGPNQSLSDRNCLYLQRQEAKGNY